MFRCAFDCDAAVLSDVLIDCERLVEVLFEILVESDVLAASDSDVLVDVLPDNEDDVDSLSDVLAALLKDCDVEIEFDSTTESL